MLTDINLIIQQSAYFLHLFLSFTGSPNIRMVIATIGIRTKKIISVRNDPKIEYGKGIKKLLAKMLLNTADGCVFQTEEAKKYFRKKLQNKSKIIYNPVDPIFYNTKKSENCNDIITIGRLELQKNHKLLIDAYIQSLNNISNEKLIIYGDGSQRETLQKYIDSKKMGAKIIMPGTVNDVQRVLAKAKLFILTSEYEGMPNAMMEAMAVGVPIIATDCPCGGPKELIRNKDQGVLVECNKIDELSKAIIKTVNDKKLLEKMSVNAKKRALEFKSEIILKEWEKYINSI